jgi:chemotaxis-related protein WspD
VYSAGTEELLARKASPDYLDMWSQLLAKEKDLGPASGQSYVIFRVGGSWLAIRAIVLREIAPPAVIRSLPHRRSELLLGLTAVRGEIYLCASLHLLIGEPPPATSDSGTRFLVAAHEGANWIFPVDEVSGIEDFPDIAMEPLPATLAHTGNIYTRGIVKAAERPVGLVDEALVFRALERKIT